MTVRYYRGIKINKNSKAKKANKEDNKRTYRGVAYSK